MDTSTFVQRSTTVVRADPCGAQHAAMPVENEGHAIDEVVDRLALRFPSISGARILSEVHARLASFVGASVRDFVPVLVEREVAEALADAARGEDA